MSEISNAEILQFAIQSGMLDTTLVQEKMIMQRREKLISKHPYSIWEGKNGSWYTYLQDDKKGRVLKKKSSKQKIEDMIVEYYKAIEEEFYISDLFNEWADGKLELGEIQKQTYDRYKTDFHRFFDESSIVKKDIRNIDESELEYFIKMTIKDKKLTNKAYAGLRTILFGVFRTAKKKKLTDISVTHFFGDIDLSKNSFEKKYVRDEDSVFTDDEVDRIAKFISDNISIINLGILLAFQTGIRVGELAALKKSDVEGNILHINKTEIRYRGADNKYVFEVRESAKTDAGNRDVILVDSALETISAIQKLNPFGEYLFMNNGKRIKEKAFSVKIVKICRYLGIEERSMHKARKTYATKLINGKVDESIVIRQLGHTNISCTKNFYYFNNKNSNEMKDQIEKAISY